MSEEQVETKAVELEEKDITSLVEDVERDLEEIDELVEAEEEDLGVSETGGLMSEEEINARLDEFQEKDHGLTIFANYYVKMLEKKAKEIGADIDFSISGGTLAVRALTLASGTWRRLRVRAFRFRGSLVSSSEREAFSC